MITHGEHEASRKAAKTPRSEHPGLVPFWLGVSIVRCWTFGVGRLLFLLASSFGLSTFSSQFLILFLLLPVILLAQGGGDLNPALKTPQEPLQRWRSLRVGAFIHWSPW